MNNPASAALRLFFYERRLHFSLNVAAIDSRNYSPQSCVELSAMSGARVRRRSYSTDCGALNIGATTQRGWPLSMEEGWTCANARDASRAWQNWSASNRCQARW